MSKPPQRAVPNPKAPNPTDIHVGQRVKMRRMHLGKSQTDVADALGLTFQQVQKYENGRNRVSASKLQGIAEFLDVPVSFFFDGISEVGHRSEPDPAAALYAEALSMPDGLALMRAFAKMQSRRERAAVVALVRELAGTPTSSNAQVLRRSRHSSLGKLGASKDV